ncbi:hypothetical protein [Peptoniphilus sp.]|uniref:hypothetical protein n=1 Tax=Peptoniphilus sp. TaxID=1971214 RepID=UPI003D911243
MKFNIAKFNLDGFNVPKYSISDKDLFQLQNVSTELSSTQLLLNSTSELNQNIILLKQTIDSLINGQKKLDPSKRKELPKSKINWSIVISLISLVIQIIDSNLTTQFFSSLHTTMFEINKYIIDTFLN